MLPAPVAPPPEPPNVAPPGAPFPPALPCAGFVGGLFPAPAGPPAPAPPPPEPPLTPTPEPGPVVGLPPAPPPADVIVVDKVATELFPDTAAVQPFLVPPVPPAPTVIG